MSHPPTVWPLQAPIRHYAWGSRTAIARLQNRAAPTRLPEAEAWFGAHPSAPSHVAGADGPLSLLELVGDDPAAQLGEAVVGRYGGRLPFLVKLLAADAPLSLQVHPSLAQARAGYAAESDRGVPLDAPHRLYRDPWPKPELLYALTPFTALCGFRGPPRTAAFLDGLGVPRLDAVRDRLATDDQRALRSVIEWALRSGRDEAAGALPQLRAAAARLVDRAGDGEAGPDADDADGWWPVAARWLVELIDRYPGDPGTIVALLLRIVRLEPGQAIHLPAGNLHAYLAGTGVEVMATSDNVLRGGLTPKHVDVDELLDVVDARFLPVPMVDAVPLDDAEVAYPTPTREFRLSRVTLSERPVTLDRRGPQIVVAVGGHAEVAADGASCALAGGHGAYLAAHAEQVTVTGDGELFRVTPGDDLDS